MKILIAGLGSIGRRHLRNLMSLGEKDILLYRTRRSSLPDDELGGFPVVIDLREALDRLREALVRVDRPDLMLDWLKKADVRRTLQAVAGHRAVTHEALDTLPPGRTLVHLRSMLVAAGALSARDERLVALERWIGQVIAGRT